MTANGHKKGFRLDAQTATLKFTGDYEGLEVVCRLDVSLATYLQFARLAELSEEEGGEQVQGLADYFRQFSDEVLLSWNLEGDDGPIPTKPDGLVNAPLTLAMTILAEWMGAVKNGPLVEASPSSSTASASGGGRSRARSSRSQRG